MPQCMVEKHQQKLRASIVIKEMDSQLNTVTICRWGLKAFISITGAAMREHNPDAMADFLDDGGCEAVLSVMNRHGETDTQIAADACLVISILSWSLKEMREFLGEIGACEMVLYISAMHMGEEAVSEHGSSAIGLLGKDHKNSFRIAEANGCDIVAQMGNFGFNLRSERCVAVATNVCYAIVCMCEATNSSRLIECGACALVIELTKLHLRDNNFASAAVKAMCALSSLNLILREELGKVGACEYILDVIPHHQTASILMDACETIMHLSLNPSNTTTLGECGACEMLVKSFREVLSDYELGCEVCTGGMLNMATYGIAAKQNRYRLIDAGAVVELQKTKSKLSMRSKENIAQLFKLLGVDPRPAAAVGSTPSSTNTLRYSRNVSGSSLVSIIHGSEMKGDTVPLQVEVHHVVEVVRDSGGDRDGGDGEGSEVGLPLSSASGKTSRRSSKNSHAGYHSRRGQEVEVDSEEVYDSNFHSNSTHEI